MKKKVDDTVLVAQLKDKWNDPDAKYYGDVEEAIDDINTLIKVINRQRKYFNE